MMIEHILYGNGLNCHMGDVPNGGDTGTCSGIIGCDGQCYPNLDSVPDFARFDWCGDCGGSATNCMVCCSGISMDDCDYTYACYASPTTEVNEVGETYLVPGQPSSTPCQWDWGDNICLYGAERGGIIKGGRR